MANTNTDAVLKSAIQEIMDLHLQMEDLKLEQKATFDMLKARGYDVPVIRKIVARMKKDRDAVISADEALFTYEGSLGLEMPNW